MARILIVEDEAHIRRVMSIWLERHGHQILHAVDGAMALQVLERDEVDLIISDMNMPGLDGLELIKAVREERRLEVPFLLVTARCDQSRLAGRLAPYNVKLYPKPFVPSRLVEDIELVLGAKAALGGER